MSIKYVKIYKPISAVGLKWRTARQLGTTVERLPEGTLIFPSPVWPETSDPIVTQRIKLPEKCIGSQVLLEAFGMTLDYLANETDTMYERWSSRRWTNDVQVFRLGLADLRRDEFGRPFDPSYDLVLLPGDGRSVEWFATNAVIYNLSVASRQHTDSLVRPLRDVNEDEDSLRYRVALVQTLLERFVKAVVEEGVVAR